MSRGCSSLTLRKGFRKPTSPPLPLRKAFFESLSLPFQRELHHVFSKTYPSFLTVKEGSTSSPKPPPPQKEGDVTAPPRSSNRYAIRLADHQRSAPGFCAGWDRMDMELLMGCLRLHDICHQRSAPGFCAGWDRMDMGLLMGCLRLPWTRSCCWTA